MTPTQTKPPGRTTPAGRARPAPAPRRPAGTTRAGRPAVDPRIRRRRADVSRAVGRRRLRWVLAALAVVALVVGAWFLLHSRWFEAKVVDVTGSTHAPAAQVEEAAGITHRTPLIDIDPGAAAARLERLPWVARATVVRQWPDGVRISVVERVPLAYVSTAPVPAVAAPGAATPAAPAGSAAPAAPAGSHPAATTVPAGSTAPAGSSTVPAASSGAPAAVPAWAVVDRSGRVLTDVASPPPGLIHLVADGVPGPPGSTLGPGDQPGVTVAASLPRAFSAQVTEVDVRGGQVTLKLTTPVTVFLGDTAQLRQKYEDTAAILAGATLVAGDVIDVSVPGSPTVGES